MALGRGCRTPGGRGPRGAGRVRRGGPQPPAVPRRGLRDRRPRSWADAVPGRARLRAFLPGGSGQDEAIRRCRPRLGHRGRAGGRARRQRVGRVSARWRRHLPYRDPPGARSQEQRARPRRRHRPGHLELKPPHVKRSVRRCSRAGLPAPPTSSGPGHPAPSASPGRTTQHRRPPHGRATRHRRRRFPSRVTPGQITSSQVMLSRVMPSRPALPGLLGRPAVPPLPKRRPGYSGHTQT